MTHKLAWAWTHSRDHARVTGLVLSGLTTLAAGSPSPMTRASCTYPRPIFSGNGRCSHFVRLAPVTTDNLTTLVNVLSAGPSSRNSVGGIDLNFASPENLADVQRVFPASNSAQCRAQANVTDLDLAGFATFCADSPILMVASCRDWSTPRARVRATSVDFTGSTTIADDSRFWPRSSITAGSVSELTPARVRVTEA